MKQISSFAESWFEYDKHDIGATSPARLSKFIIDLKVPIDSWLKLMEFSVADKKEDQKTRIRSKPKHQRREMETKRKTKRIP